MPTRTKRLSRIVEVESRRHELLRELDRLDRRRHAAIVAALEAGASLTAVAGELGITRQALSKYLDRRESTDA